MVLQNSEDKGKKPVTVDTTKIVPTSEKRLGGAHNDDIAIVNLQ